MADVGISRVHDPISWPVVRDRIAYLKKLVRGMDVLDIGCTGRKGSGRLPDHAGTLHHAIRPVCASLTGVDIDAGGVEAMRAAGYRVVLGDAASVRLNRAFDVIIAAEVLEHLSNPGRFLLNAARHLEPGGQIVLTTPNAFYPKRLLEIVLGGQAVVHPQHVSWYCPQTLAAVVRRAGFVDVQIVPFDNSERFRWLVGRLTSFRPWLSTNLLVTARKPVTS